MDNQGELLTDTTRGNKYMRVMKCMTTQFKKHTNNVKAPPSLRVDGKLVLVTGTTKGGIGYETVCDLLQRGASVILAGRNKSKLEHAMEQLNKDVVSTKEYNLMNRLHTMQVDLADLQTVKPAIESLAKQVAGRQIDILVENAGVWAMAGSPKTNQGYELEFGTNVLGHFALRDALISNKLLSPTVRIVIVTGDIYCLATNCSSTHFGGYEASKLGNIWIAKQLQERNPKYQVRLVHPGVIASGLAGGSTGCSATIKGKILIDTQTGAQTSIFACVADQEQFNLPPCAYLHNCRGLLSFDEADVASNESRAETLWNECQHLWTDFAQQK